MPRLEPGDTPERDAIPTLDSDRSGTVVWHREHLRVRDQAAVARAAAAEYVLPAVRVRSGVLRRGRAGL